HRSAPIQSLYQEQPPDGFGIEFGYISHARDLAKFDVWLSLVWYMTSMALNPWNLNLPREIDFPECYNVNFFTTSSITPPRFQAKSLIWTLREAFRWYYEQELYSSSSFITRIDGKLLGLTTLKSALTLPGTGERQAKSAISSLSASSLGRRGMEIRLNYLPNGDSFRDVGFFKILIELLIWCAGHDPKTASPGTVRAYNIDDDYTFQMEPMDSESYRDLPFAKVIEALGRLPVKMVAEGRGGRWTELKAQIRVDGVNIGRISILKGLPEPSGLEGCYGSNMTTVSR
ncbi:MAG: hypothetical protein Q9224_006124, partial [Gallowayella concinna]